MAAGERLNRCSHEREEVEPSGFLFFCVVYGMVSLTFKVPDSISVIQTVSLRHARKLGCRSCQDDSYHRPQR